MFQKSYHYDSLCQVVLITKVLKKPAIYGTEEALRVLSKLVFKIFNGVFSYPFKIFFTFGIGDKRD